MNRRIPSWIAMAASGVLVTASALAQSQGSAGGENPQPGGTNTAAQSQASTSDTKASAKSSHHAKKTRHMKAHHKSTSTTSSSGTEAARGLNAQMSQCAAKTDRNERAACARTVWESTHGTTG